MDIGPGGCLGSSTCLSAGQRRERRHMGDPEGRIGRSGLALGATASEVGVCCFLDGRRHAPRVLVLAPSVQWSAEA